MPARRLHYVNTLAMLLVGCYIASYGPLIPYMANETGQDETHYAYIFFVRSTASLLGSLFVKKVGPLVNIRHFVLGICLTLSGSLIINTFSLSTINLVITLFLASISIVMLNIVFVSFNFTVFSTEEATHHIQLLGFVFGAGAMISPFIVMHLELNTYLYMAVPALLLIPLYLSQDLPALNQQKAHRHSAQIMGFKSEALVCIMMVIYATEEVGMSSWIPTYAIKTDVADYQDSAVYSMYFWLTNCFFRLIWLVIPLAFNKKLKFIVTGLFCTTFVVLLIHLAGQYQWVCYAGPITSGLLLSNLYAFLLAFPVQQGFVFTNSNSSNLVIANCLGEGLLITPLGWSMNVWGVGFFILFLWVASGLLWYIYGWSLKSMEEDHNGYRESLLGDAESNLVKKGPD